MESLLQSLYDGDIYPAELIVSKDPEYRAVNRKVSDIMENYERRLPPDEYKKLEELFDLRAEVTGMDAAQSFIYGFKLGAMLLVEVFTGKAELVRRDS